jgi:hypothetical protein
MMERIPLELLPPETKELISTTSLEGQLDHCDLAATIDLDLKQPDPSALKHFTLNSTLSGIYLSMKDLPNVTIERCVLTGNEAVIQTEFTQAGHPFFTFENAHLDLNEPLANNRSILFEGIFNCDLDKLRTLWPTLPIVVRESIPDTTLINSLEGILTGNIEMASPLILPWKPEYLSLKTKGKYNSLKIPQLVTDLQIGNAQGNWSAEIIEAKAKGEVYWEPETLIYQSIFSGSPRVAVCFDVALNGLGNLSGRCDLANAQIQHPTLSWHKLVGQSSNIQWSIRFDAGLGDRSPQLKIETTLTNLVFEKTQIEANIVFNHDFTQPFMGFERMDITSLSIDEMHFKSQLNVIDSNTLMFNLQGGTVNLPKLIQLVEPMLISLMPTESTDSELTATTTPVESSPAQNAPSLQPSILWDIAIDNITLNATRSLDRFNTQGSLRNGLPADLVLSVHNGLHPLWFEMQPNTSGHTFTLKIEDLSEFLTVCIAPLDAFTPGNIQLESIQHSLKDLFRYTIGGNLKYEGQLRLSESPALLSSNLNLESLTLQAPIPLLNQIAKLANKEVLILVPFNLFSIQNIQATPENAAIDGFFMDGPINLSFENIKLTEHFQELHAIGKVFGICFEIKGPVNDPSIFLCEKGSVIQSVTTQDDFEW